MKLNPFRKTISLDEDEAEALLFHYNKNGIPKTQVAAKKLERKLCKFLGQKTKDEYVAPCAGARHDGEIEGERTFWTKLNALRRENECVGGDQSIVNAVRLLETNGIELKVE